MKDYYISVHRFSWIKIQFKNLSLLVVNLTALFSMSTFVCICVPDLKDPFF